MFTHAQYSLGRAEKCTVAIKQHFGQVYNELELILKIAQLPGNTEQLVGTVGKETVS